MELGRCPGLYCGRVLLGNGSWGECGVCPRGFRVNATSTLSACAACADEPTFYDWLYLGFMVIFTLVLHWFFIDMVAMRRSFTKDALALHLTALVEVLGAVALSLLSADPFGSFEIKSCGVKALSDWYTLFYNPTPQYETTIHCTQEAVYPLNTLVFTFLGLALLLMLVIRPWVCSRCLPRQGKMSVYAAMYYIPVLALFQVTIGGLIYYAFPYVLIILSALSSAAHFATKLDPSMISLIKSIFHLRDIVILLSHWFLLAFGIVAITQAMRPVLLLVPLPTLFYILTSKFTDPNKLHND